MYGPVLAVVYEAAGSCTWGSTSQLVDPTWALRPPSDVSVSSGGGTPTATYKAGRTGGCISGTRAALSSMACSVTSAAAYETYIWGSREWSEAPEVTAGPSWAIAEAALNQTHIHSLLQRTLKGHNAS